MTNDLTDRIHRIWDQLADFPASQPNTALQFLLESVSELIGADHGYWLSAVLMQSEASGDPMLGWRPGPVFHYRPLPDDTTVYVSNIKDLQKGRYEVDESTFNHVRQAGHFRATLLRDHVSPAFYLSEHYLNYYQGRGISDTLFVVAPVNADAEVYFCFNRMGDNPRFTAGDLAVASDVLRGLKWFYSRLLLSHGLMLAEKALTPAEKRILKRLLTERSEKQIAEDLGQKLDTTHKHVLAIYRKFNVRSRAALMAIWLGNRPA